MKSIVTIFSLIFAAAPLAAQTEFLVNTYQDSTQRDPKIARDAAGNYVVAWKSEGQVDSASAGDIFLQFFNADDSPAGAETLVNTTTAGDQDKPAVAMNASGDLIVAWASHTGFSTLYDIRARLFNHRLPAGDEFAVNTTVSHSQTNPAAAMDDSGNFVIVWDSWFQDGSDRGVYGQRFDPTGQKLGPEFRINITTAYSQARPAVSMFPDGRFVVIWESWKQDIVTPSGYGIFGRIFAADGTPETGEFQVNTVTNDFQWLGDVETLDDGGFAVVWCSWEQDGDDGGIFFQRFDQDGMKIGGEQPVNKTTVQYQWLPKIRKFPDGTFGVIWSSWKQDGSREGIFARLLDSTGRALSFETPVNTTTENFQWEPDFVPSGPGEMLAVWSSWGQTGKNYEVVGRRFRLSIPVGYVSLSPSNHTAGRSTTSFIVHVVDSTALTGDSYELHFRADGSADTTVSVINVSTQDTVVREFKVNRGAGVFSLTPEFDGVAVEILLELHLSLDIERSSFINTSGTNLIFEVGKPTAGVPMLAPIDAALVWGSPDTLSNGHYASPLDTALNISGIRNVVVPFRAWNLTDNERMELLVIESGGVVNQRFDPGERIVFLTPPAYRTQANHTHAQIATILPSGPLTPPAPGDTNFVRTRRPITGEDRFVFTTTPSLLVAVPGNGASSPATFTLEQNYPNPFNPTTTIRFTVPVSGRVRLSVFDLLGRHIATLVDGPVEAGTHKVLFQSGTLSSGVYFYTIDARDVRITRKMLLLR